MKTISMSIPDRTAMSRRHNPTRLLWRDGMTNSEMEVIILELYGLRKISDIPLDLTFAVEDDKKYMMYLLRGLL